MNTIVHSPNVMPRKKISIEDIRKAAVKYFGVSIVDLDSRNLDAKIAEARCISMYAARRLTRKSTGEIAQSFGERPVYLVYEAVKTVKGNVRGIGDVAASFIRALNEQFAQDVPEIKAQPYRPAMTAKECFDAIATDVMATYHLNPEFMQYKNAPPDLAKTIKEAQQIIIYAAHIILGLKSPDIIDYLHGFVFTPPDAVIAMGERRMKADADFRQSVKVLVSQFSQPKKGASLQP